ncbi:hypothetical protein ABZS59_36215 [Streptomyces flaveolus]|jgi:hypothetical protein|uniref:hypothetical protein n=1 Tax=Streptomyces flaveolus TaxID=67297 RepID=UPI0033BDD86B
MVSDLTPLRHEQAAINRLTERLADLGVPATAIQALVDNADPGRCDHYKGFSDCQLDLGHPEEDHFCVHSPLPGEKTQTKWATRWNSRSKWALDRRFTLPDPATPAMRAHAELVDEARVFTCQPVTDTLLYLHIRLGRNDTGLHTWMHRIGLSREQATRTEHGDYLARGHLNGARIALIAHAYSYR